MVLELKYKREGKEVRAKVISMEYNGGEIIAAVKKTEIHVERDGQKEPKETRAGVSVLELLTDRGGLNIRY